MKLCTERGVWRIDVYLKSKEPRLRDWNLMTPLPQAIDKALAWNQKNLDYEIETLNERTTIHTSSLSLKSKEPRLRDWNDIEPSATVLMVGISLKSKEPRLRDWNIVGSSQIGDLNIDLKSKEPRLRDWNILRPMASAHRYRPWNQKNLDYEIETKWG